ncbi:MAG: tRNA (adenosine(37)-N6)-threonylcarbamoyltransferase complex dimerization subunit type 1 TsaB [Clostridia bacterium]|nr:tRNA (adenosine(37)-N6)-threonylcarbamoyltransferase complex dimerization subunit type 1 TsaB [Clostridia bacterium]
MKILAIDTSGPNCNVAVLEEDMEHTMLRYNTDVDHNNSKPVEAHSVRHDGAASEQHMTHDAFHHNADNIVEAHSVRQGKVIANFTINIGKTHSETLLPLVDELLKFSNISLNDIDAFACCVGPGSFTGIRIGIATMKGFALSLNKPTISVSTLEGLAYNVPTFDGLVCSILDAKNNNVYSALYKLDTAPQMIGDYLTNSIDSLIEEIKKHDEKVLFVGDGAISYHDMLQNELNERAFFAPYYFNGQSAVSIAKAAFDKLNQYGINYSDELHPLYLRKSQAERMLEET